MLRNLAALSHTISDRRKYWMPAGEDMAVAGAADVQGAGGV